MRAKAPSQVKMLDITGAKPELVQQQTNAGRDGSLGSEQRGDIAFANKDRPAALRLCEAIAERVATVVMPIHRSCDVTVESTGGRQQSLAPGFGEKVDVSRPAQP